MNGQLDITSDEQSKAIVIDHGVFYYDNKVKVLDDLNFNAQKGQITALLGPTGTGKTTLIRLVLGQISLNSGSVAVFGRTPGSHSLAIPGPNVGYMPQELALFMEFTVGQILSYYGQLYHLDDNIVQNRIYELTQLLQLPENSRPIARLSGGQQRRVSIAVTLLHRPKLVILDEPTVGVDPLLRKDIWDHLKVIARAGQTVVITTHYIEEARSAHTVAFMNYGKILAQGDPTQLMDKFESTTLENVFLLLCQSKDSKHIQAKYHVNYPKAIETKTKRDDNDQSKLNFELYRVEALLKKNLMQVTRAIWMIWLLLLPVVIILVHVSVNRLPRDNPIAVYNADIGSNLSKLLLDSFDSNYIKITYFSSNESAFDSVVKGINRISLVIPENFSDAFELRIRQELTPDDDVLDSHLLLSVDGTDVASNLAVQQQLLRALMKFFVSAGKELVGHDLSNYFQMVTVHEYFYGSFQFNMSRLFITGGMINVIWFINAIYTVHQVLNDHMSSSYERTLVTGVTKLEYMLAHFLNTMLLALVPIVESILLVFYIFQYQVASSIMVASTFFLLLMVSLMGWSIGYFIGNSLSEYLFTSFVTFTLFTVFTIMSGTFWPRESLPRYLYYVTMLVPTTYPNIALQAILSKEWTITSPSVYYGFLSCSFYIVFPLITKYKSLMK